MDADSRDAAATAVKSLADAMLNKYMVLSLQVKPVGQVTRLAMRFRWRAVVTPKSEEVAQRFCFRLFILRHATCLGEAFKTICLEQHVL